MKTSEEALSEQGRKKSRIYPTECRVQNMWIRRLAIGTENAKRQEIDKIRKIREISSKKTKSVKRNIFM